MSADILPLKPNYRTHERKRREREATKRRLIERIGIDPHDAPLFDEELAFMAYERSLDRD